MFGDGSGKPDSGRWREIAGMEEPGSSSESVPGKLGDASFAVPSPVSKPYSASPGKLDRQFAVPGPTPSSYSNDNPGKVWFPDPDGKLPFTPIFLLLTDALWSLLGCPSTYSESNCRAAGKHGDAGW